MFYLHADLHYNIWFWIAALHKFTLMWHYAKQNISHDDDVVDDGVTSKSMHLIALCMKLAHFHDNSKWTKIAFMYLDFVTAFLWNVQYQTECTCVSRPCVYKVDYSDAIMSTIASQITSLTIVYSTVYSGADQRKHHPPSLAFVREIYWWLVNSPHNGPVTWEMFPFDDVIM